MSYGIIYKQMSSEYIYSVYVGYPDYSYANYSYSESELWLKGGRGWLRNFWPTCWIFFVFHDANAFLSVSASI